MRQVFCRHRFWSPTDALITELPDYSLSISWTGMVCQRCGKVRTDNMLKGGESVVLPMDEFVQEVT